MNPNPYSPPHADVQLTKPQIEIPEAIAKKIKSAWIAALISAAMTLLATLAAIYGKAISGFDAWNFIDLLLILGLAFGIYKRSRTCAVEMLVYFVISKIITFADTGKASGIVLALVFMYCCWQGVVGTFAYHGPVKS